MGDDDGDGFGFADPFHDDPFHDDPFHDVDPSFRPGGDIVDRSSADAVERVHVPGWRRPGRWYTAAMFVVLIAVVYYLVTLAQVVQTGRSHGAEPASAIVVMGAAQYDGRPSPQLARRLDHVLTLWHEGTAPYVVVTGGKRPGDRFTEADASRAYLVERGVPTDVILAEAEGRTTHESLSAAATMLIDRGITRVIVVTDPYHSLRSRLVAEDLGLDVDVAAAPNSVVGGWESVRRHVEEAGGVALGRLIGFGRLADLMG